MEAHEFTYDVHSDEAAEEFFSLMGRSNVGETRIAAMRATRAAFLAGTKGTAVFIEDGSAEDRDGDEIRTWFVYEGDDDGEIADGGRSSYCSSRDAAFDYAEKIAAGREIVAE